MCKRDSAEDRLRGNLDDYVNRKGASHPLGVLVDATDLNRVLVLLDHYRKEAHGKS